LHESLSSAAVLASKKVEIGTALSHFSALPVKQASNAMFWSLGVSAAVVAKQKPVNHH